MKNTRRTISVVLMAAALLLLITSFFLPAMKGDTDSAARRVESVVKSRLAVLDRLAEKALAEDEGKWLELKVPDDMVVYRYVGNNLQSWINQFPISSDDIIQSTTSYRLSNPRTQVYNPLASVGEEYGFFRFGQKSYLVKRVGSGNVKVIVGLNVGENSRFRMSSDYVVSPLGYPGASSLVRVAGEPAFSIRYDAMPTRSVLPANCAWLAFIFFCIGLLLSLSLRRGLGRGLLTIALMLGSAVWAYLRHPVMQGEITQILIILVINILVFFVSMALYLVRKDVWTKVGRRKGLKITLSVIDLLAVCVLLVFAYVGLFKIINYTHISMELYRIGLLSVETGFVYVSFALLLVGLVLMVQMLRFADVFTLAGRVCSALAMAVFLVAITSALGFQKEENIISQWAEVLSNERDIEMENHLLRVERLIAYDEVLARASESEDLAALAVRQLSENYFFRSLKTYELSVRIGGDSELLGLDNGVQIAPGSRFYYAPLAGQRCRYAGAFHYFVPDKGQNTIFIILEPKDFAGGDALEVIPPFFSYAKYKGADRQYYKGNYAYPTKLTEAVREKNFTGNVCHFTADGYVHYVNGVGNDEYIVISRPHHGELRNILSVVFLAILFYLILSIFRIEEKHRPSFEKNYFKTVVTCILLASLTITMATLAGVSVTFVTNRYEANARTLMSDKVNAIRAMLQSGLRSVNTPEELTSRETMVMLRRTSDNTMSNISLFRPDGRVFMSTTPEMFDRMVVGCRMNGAAYEEIMYRNRGFSILRERYGAKQFYTMYAPILDADGEILCLFASPYIENSYDFRMDTIMHSASIVVVFLLLLMLSSLLVSFLIDRIFDPLTEMRRKMENAGVDTLEHISYDHNDEIKALVDSYNRMVDDLAASSRALAQAERDKAWSEMARNVAHEIKNPLTPMQLQIQRVQRLKANGDPNWQLRFDEMAKVLLDHIEVLTDTANNFSDFAKLYSEEPVEIRLDDLLREEVAMYDSRPGVEFEYLGLPDAVIHGPRPQLVRVFVNLLNNAVQACEEVGGAHIAVSLRNGADSKFYEIVFEDNGPGVDAANIERLFTPKFTTKSSGSGLGLSISRSILERCGATICYQRSFRLGGACFIVSYPKD